MITRSRVLAVLSILPLVYVAVFSALPGWWFTSFDASKVTNARVVIVGFYSVAAVHLLMMALMLGLLIYFFAGLRGGSATMSEKIAWVVALLALNFLAYPFFYFFYVRPRLRSLA
ncbi:MAG TPA: hypothetical protein VE010_11915 [Thermoanaerobaculia bacterium]|nr:hypothetical protein [Thermoanaerobaculia bacterium]